jgi:Flp pilus assembly protein TadG
MKSNPLVKPNRQSAQAMIEFALVFPLLVFLLYGILEFGRMLFVYTSVVNASREAARYGASVGNLGAYRFLDCDGILAAARRNAILNTIDAPDNLTISYDRGPGTSAYANSCATVNESDVVLGDRINVTVTIPYAPLMPVNFASFNITSTASRTIIRSVEISGSVVGAAGTPTVTFSADSWPEPRDEGAGEVIFSVQLDFATDLTVVVPLNLSGTAINNLDYAINTVSVTLAPGETSKNVVIAMIDDALDEYNETVIVSMGTPINALKGVPNVFTLTIADNDDPPDIYFAAPSSIFDEEVGSVSVAVSLSAVSGKDITFNYNFVETGSTAFLTADFTLGPTAVTIPAGQPGGVLIITLINDTLYENDEILNLLLASVNPGDDGQPTAFIVPPDTHALTIRNTDPPPVVNFELPTSITAETVGLVRLKLRLNRISGLDTTATLIVDGASTAVLNTDYTIPTLTVTVPAGEIEAEFVVNITNDVEPPNEIDELLLLRIDPIVVNGTRGPLFNHTVTIKETLTQPSISFTTSWSICQ